MYVIAGLGNPGKQYEKTRHNMGFLVLDRLSEMEGIRIGRLRHRALIGDGRIGNERVLLVKPQTYMNNSGESLGEIVRYYGVDPEHLIVIYDDMDLPAGTIRIRKKGGPGTHNGMRSVVSHLQGEKAFPRIRVGIGKTGSDEWKDFVLDKVGKREGEELAKAVDTAAKAVCCILKDGIDIAMNRYNVKPEKPAKEPKEKASQEARPQQEAKAEAQTGEHEG